MSELKPQDFASNANELKKNIDIIQATFEKFGLEVLNVGLEYQGMLGGNGIKFYVEILGNEELDPDTWYEVKINVYDKDGGLISMDSEMFLGDSFSGFDTMAVAVFGENIWQDAAKARIYFTKG